MVSIESIKVFLFLLAAVPSCSAFTFSNMLYKIHVCPHAPGCPPPMCGPGIKIHECNGKYRTCSSDESCDYARCTAGDTGCYYSCAEGTCQRVYSCDEGDCSSTYSYSTCNDKHCNFIDVSGGGSGGGSGGSGSGGSGGSSSGSSSYNGGNGADGSTSSFSTASTQNNSTSKNESPLNRWYNVMGLVLAALVASVVIANALLHRRNRTTVSDHALAGSLEKRMRLFARGVPKRPLPKPTDPAAYQLEQDNVMV